MEYLAMRMNKLLIPSATWQNVIMDDCTDIKFKTRQNSSMMVEVRLVVTFGKGQ